MERDSDGPASGFHRLRQRRGTDRCAADASISSGASAFLALDEVMARSIDVNDVGAVTARERPDVALVGLGESSDHALMLIEKIVQDSACPVIVLIHATDPEFVREASKHENALGALDGGPTAERSLEVVVLREAPQNDVDGALPVGALTVGDVGEDPAWSATRSTRGAPSTCCANGRVKRTASSSTWRLLSWTGTRSCREGARAGRLAPAATGGRRPNGWPASARLTTRSAPRHPAGALRLQHLGRRLSVGVSNVGRHPRSGACRLRRSSQIASQRA